MVTRKIQKLINNAVVIALLATGLIYVCSRFLHLGNVEYTDNAQVKQHITPVNTRVQGFRFVLRSTSRCIKAIRCL